jgi:hypothetical protein
LIFPLLGGILGIYPPLLYGRSFLSPPSPIDPEGEVSFGLFQGELSLYLNLKTTLWRYGYTTRRWHRVYTGKTPIEKLLLHPYGEGVFFLEGDSVVGTFPPKRKWNTYPLRGGIAFRGRETIYLVTPKTVLLITPSGEKTFPFSGTPSAGVEWMGKPFILETNGLITDLKGNSLPLPSARSLLSCGNFLLVFTEEGGILYRDNHLQPFPYEDALCDERGNIIGIQDGTLLHFLTGKTLGEIPFGIFSPPTFAQMGNRFLFAFLTGEGILLERFSLPSTLPENYVSEKGKEEKNCYRSLEEILSTARKNRYRDEKEIRNWLKRVRTSSYLPLLTLSSSFQKGTGYTLTVEPIYTSSVTERLFVIGPDLYDLDQRESQTFSVEIRLSWNLDRLIYHPEEPDIVREWDRNFREIERFFQYISTLWEIVTDPKRTSSERIVSRAILKELTSIDPVQNDRCPFP